MVPDSSPTKRQQEILDIISRHISERGYPPTLREIAEETGIRGISAIKGHIDRLVSKGLLVRERGARSLTLPRPDSPASLVEVPILGQVAAGRPTLSEENLSGHLSVDPLWIRKGPVFFLKVHGESMKGAAILDGDYVLVRCQETAENGQIVVATIDGETTVKRLKQRGERLSLLPENPDFSEIPVLKGQSFRLIGLVVGVFRLIDGLLF
ncbi:MAG: transcriptional repressor LexA [Leptospirillia bacterium]